MEGPTSKKNAEERKSKRRDNNGSEEGMWGAGRSRNRESGTKENKVREVGVEGVDGLCQRCDGKN